MSRRWHYQQQTIFDRLPEPPTTSIEPAMEFPQFPNGDTLVVISASRKYKLHSAILASSSSVLDLLIKEYAPPRVTKAVERSGITVRYRFTLALNEEQGAFIPGPDSAFEQPMYLLKRQVLAANGRVIEPIIEPLGDSNENGRVVPTFLVAWEKVLGAFYNRPLDLGDTAEISISHLLDLASEIMKIAEYLDCVAIVNSQIEAAFLSLGQTLHRSIATYPAPWVEFSYRLRSKKMFKEALIHAVGKYNSEGMKQAMRENIFTPSVVQLLEHKSDLLCKLAKNIETMLISWYPDQLMRAKTVGRADRDSIGRASYANDIIFWMSLTVFRHWLTQMIVNDKGHTSVDMGYEFFRLISRGGDGYLSKDVLNQFHNFFPMSQKGEGVTENRLTEIKHYARGLVKDALINHSLLDTDRFPAGHMTCVPVNPEDYPWLRYEPDPLSDLDAIAATDEYGNADAVSDADMDADDGTATMAAETIPNTANSNPDEEDWRYQRMSDEELDDDKNPVLDPAYRSGAMLDPARLNYQPY